MADLFRVIVLENGEKRLTRIKGTAGQNGLRGLFEGVHKETGTTANSPPLASGLMSGEPAAAARETSLTTQEPQGEGQKQPPPGYLEKLVQSCSAAIIGTTLEGTIITWNAGAERLYGYSAAESAGKPLSALYSPHRPEELADHLERVREGKAINCHETVHCRQNGHQVEVAVSMSPIMDGGGTVIGASLVAQDISQRKQEEKERLELIQELTSALSRTAGPWLEKTRRC